MTASFRLPPLVADGGELRLARRVASFVYGRREVEWPEDVDDPEELLPDGREFGWVAKLGDSEPGLSERRFVRADVKINAAEGYSDVEQALDDSALRAGGEVYFESVIEEDGLGLLIPGVDFRQGDLVDVRFWGRILKDQLVTSIDWVDGKPSVALGGQSIRDTGELARARAEMVRLINGERADRVDDVSKVSKRVDTVDGKAQSAQVSADEALQATADNRTYIDEQLDAAGVAVELGREYLLQMQQHVTAGVAHSGLAQSMASEANSYAQQAIAILDQLDPLRDDVLDAHAQVTALHEQALLLTDQAVEHVRQASQHAADAVASASSASQHAADGKQYAADALAEAELAEGFADSASAHAADGKQYADNALAEANRASEFVGQASSHAETARDYATQAQSHADEGARQSGLAAGSASDALQNANRAQGIVDDANGLLSQVQGYSQEAKDALSDAESLLANAGGSGKSLGDVLLEVAQKHQETLTAHDDILDLHSEVLEKHGEAIRYVAIAAAQASAAAQHAATAAQESLDVATNAALAAGAAADAAESAGEVAESALQVGQDAANAADSASAAADEAAAAAQSATKVGEDAALAAGHAADAADEAGKAASSAGQAADEAAQAASNNSAAIGKLEEADGKLQEADQKLQQQIDVLEDSQELLAKAVQILAGAVAQAAMAAQSALSTAEDAGNAAGSALDAIDALGEAIEARDASIDAFTRTQEAIDAEQNDLINQIAEMQKEQAAQNNNRIHQIMATKASTTWPGVKPFVTRDQYWGITLPTSGGALVHVEWLKDTTNGLVRTIERIGYPNTGWNVEARDDEIVKASWGAVSAVQVSIDREQRGFMPGQFNWHTLEELTHTAGKNATQGLLTLNVLWDAANRGSEYKIRILVDGQQLDIRESRTLGPLTSFGDGRATQSLTVSNVRVPAGKSVTVEVASSAPKSGSRFVQRATLKGTWLES